jgi:16S rRNA (adenine1518-N6/adenine1519-N6)-dimethyltransferase
MAQTKHQIQAILAEASAVPRQRFGQNFMIDGNLVRLIADAGGIEANDLVIEVGPGTGTLTEELIAKKANVLAVEIDRALAELLKARFAEAGNFSLICGDALDGKHAINAELLTAIQEAKKAGKTVRLVANLPYNIASPLIIELLIAGVDVLAFTVQKEVADRLRGEPGSKEYGTLSIVVQLLSKVELVRTMPRQAFWPMPKIESALVRLTRNDRLGERAGEFGRFVRQIFSARRKTLRNALALAEIDAGKVLEKLEINPQLRPEELSPGDYVRMFEMVRSFAERGDAAPGEDAKGH